MPARYGTGRVGRPSGGAVASESVDRGVAPAPEAPSRCRVAAGMSSAASSVRLAMANGPDPIGWRPNG